MPSRLDSPPLPPPPGVLSVPIRRVEQSLAEDRHDVLAVEEPLEIRLAADDSAAQAPAPARRRAKPLSVTMRTPGHDFELAAGFLFTEGIVTAAGQIQAIRYDGLPIAGTPLNVVRVDLRPGVRVDLARLQRHFYTTSSCGVCGKASIEAIKTVAPADPHPPRPPTAPIDPATIHRLPGLLRDAQTTFDRTGGLHAAGLFDFAGNFLCLREDVGRHNAMDKLIGHELLAGRVPLSDRILMLSGRSSFELVQKAMMAGIPVIAAVGAPSSLAVELARDRGITLLGFVRDGRFNVYGGAQRLKDIS